ncbi:IS1 family transposase [Methanocella conradii]|uniref:IS1 family transposase n=1 Tax=Methanocella conradii TaxID=1175444 RepID=UPI00157C5133|nr:IS1 family transposase [Methanocella conradii]
MTAINPDTRLLISHVEGHRDTNDAVALFRDEELIIVYGRTETPLYKGRGRKPYPVRVPLEDLKYAQICKNRLNGRVIEVVQRVVYGRQDEVLRLLDADEGGRINTSYVERLNLTIRNSSARFIRKGMNYSKDAEIHSKAIDFFQA